MHANFHVTLTFVLPILKISIPTSILATLHLGRGEKKKKQTQLSLASRALSVSRALESEVIVHSCRTACSVVQH